jgi:short-subunit dehydrogenase
MNAREGRAMIVTGASSGIGRALALQAAHAGFGVLGVGRRPDALAQLASEIRASGGAVETMVADVGDVRSASAIVGRALDRFARLDVLVNNAGFVTLGEILNQTDAEIAAQFATHVAGPIALTRHALPALRRTHGQVFFLGSGLARVPIGGFGTYPAAKAALRSAVAAMRRELAREGITATYVDPGVVDTAFMTRAGAASAPARILVSPEEVARKILAAVATRPRVLNAVPWQTLAVALAELFPQVVDIILERAPQLVGTPALGGAPAVQAGPASASLFKAPDSSAPPASVAKNGVSAVLAPLANRMERLKMREDFVRSLLVPGKELELGDVAMRWAGMPNKNERAATAEVLEALALAGYLESTGEQTWTVTKAGD